MPALTAEELPAIFTHADARARGLSDRDLYRWRDEGRIEILSGVNLPMVVRLACARDSRRSLAETARWLEIKGRRSICRAGAVARGPLPGGEPRRD